MHPRQLRQLQSVIVSMPFAHLNRTLPRISAVECPDRLNRFFLASANDRR
jgi:hypothetical protein